MNSFKGTNRKVIIDPYDKDKIFVDGYTLDGGNISVWVNETENYKVTQAEAKKNAEMITQAFDVAQRYGSIEELLRQHKDALNALKMAQSFIERNVENLEQDPVLNAVLNRVIKKSN